MKTIFIVILCVGILLFDSCIRENKTLPDIHEYEENIAYDLKEYNTHKNLGRNAVLIYLIETNQIKDSVISIDIHRLESIEDSLKTMIKK